MFRPFNLDAERVLRAIARDSAGEPAVAAASPAELTLLTMATRISPVMTIQVDVGQLTESGGATPDERARVRFPREGIVTALSFAELEAGVIYDQAFQIYSTQGFEAALGFDNDLNVVPLNAQAFFGADSHRRDVSYRIRNKDDTWTVQLYNLRGQDTSHPILQIDFLPGGEA